MPQDPITISVIFPFKGLDLATGTQSNAPFTTAICSNVWPYDASNRLVGSQRPGTSTAFGGQTFGNFIQYMATATLTSNAVTKKLIVVGGQSALAYSADQGSTWANSTYAYASGLTYQGIKQGAADARSFFFVDGVQDVQEFTYDDTQVSDKYRVLKVPTSPIAGTLCCLWRDRLIVSGVASSPHLVYASRQGLPLDVTTSSNGKYDWDVSADDASAPWVLNVGQAGKVGEPVTGLMPFTDDTLIISTARTLHRLDGDPTAGGSLSTISTDAGCGGGQAFCMDLAGNLYFTNEQGLWRYRPGSGVENLSQSRVGALFRQLAKQILVYDPNHNGVWIFQYRIGGLALYYDIGLDSFWPMNFNVATHKTDSAMWYRDPVSGVGNVLMGGGSTLDIKKIGDGGAGTADAGGLSIVAEVLLGVFQPGGDMQRSRLLQSSVTLGDNRQISGLGDSSIPASARVDVEYIAADDAQTIITTLALTHAFPGSQTDTFTDWGAQLPTRHRLTGNSFAVRLKTNGTGKTWSFDRLSLVLGPAGRVR